MNSSPKSPSSHVVMQWLRRNFSDPGAVSLLIVIVSTLLIFEFFGNILAPILVSLVFAYMLNTLVQRLENIKVPHLVAVLIVFLFFLGLLIVGLIWLLPLLSKQTLALMHQLPNAFAQGKIYVAQMMQRFPGKVAPSQWQDVMNLAQAQMEHVGRYLFSFSLATIPGIAALLLYLILVPVMVFFFLKDRTALMQWVKRFLPTNRQVIDTVWHEVHQKIIRYIKGRILEVFIVGIVSAIVFSLLGLPYAILLASVVGVSVIVPYVGAVIATIPVIVVGLMQWGLSAHFIYLVISYTVIAFLDGYILVPLLFAGTMNLHPVAIIIGILVFGGIWGVWGVFFAIPLVTLLKAILDVWPHSKASA